MLDRFWTNAESGLRISLLEAGGDGGCSGSMSLTIRLGERETAGSSISFVQGKKIFCASGPKNNVSSWKTRSPDFTRGFVDGL